MSKFLSGMVFLLVLLVIVSPLSAQTIGPAPGSEPVQRAIQIGEPVVLGMDAMSELNLTLSLEGTLVPGVLGLPGEPVTWVITLTNEGDVPGQNVVITDTLRDDLRIENVEIATGEVAVSEQVVVFTIPELPPRTTIEMKIHTTVLYSPPNGLLVNQVILVAAGADGTYTQSAAADLFVPTGLPATGYAPPHDLPGEGEPSVGMIGLAAFGMVAATAAFVWYRGRRYFG